MSNKMDLITLNVKKDHFLSSYGYQILHFVMTIEHLKYSKSYRFSYVINKLNFKPAET